MANNIYIGNRYVPIFANPIEWDNLREYEPLTIVTYEGTSYTSRQRVPVGTALSNTDYWAVTGNYNAQVEQYRQEVASVGDRVTTLEGTVSGHTSAINSLNSEVNLLTNRRFVIIGDSYSIGTTSGGTTEGWTYHFKQRGGFSASECYVFDEGGSGFVGNITNKFIDLLNAGEASVSNHNTITDVVFAGGYNDANKNSSTLVSNIQSAINRAKELFPNANVWVAMLGYSTQNSGDNRASLISVSHDYYVSTIYVGGKYVVNSEMFLPSDPWDYMSDDGIHPNHTGYLIMGNAMYDAIMTNGCMPVVNTVHRSITITPDTNISNIALSPYLRIEGNNKYLCFAEDNPSFSFTANQNSVGNSSVTIGTISTGLYGKSGLDGNGVPCRVAVRIGTTFYGYHAHLYVEDKKLKLNFKDIPSSGESWAGFENVSQIYFEDRNFTFSTRRI